MGCAINIAHIHIRFYEKGAYIHGVAMVNWRTNFSTFGVYKRMWYPDYRIQFKVEGEHIEVHQDCQFITFTPVGVGLAGVTGDMDEAIAVKGLHEVIRGDALKLVKHAQSIAPPIKNHITEAVFLATFTKVCYMNGEPDFYLRGVVHTDQRLYAAITEI